MIYTKNYSVITAKLAVDWNIQTMIDDDTGLIIACCNAVEMKKFNGFMAFNNQSPFELVNIVEI